MYSNEINRLTSRHIAKLLNRLAERYAIEPDIQEAIKAQFRMLQDDITTTIGEVKSDKNGNRQ